MSKTLFLAACIPSRILLAYIAFKFPSSQILSLVTFIIAIGFFYIYSTGSRKTGIETGGQPIWWNDMRPVHGLLYLLYSLSNLAKVKNAWVFLALDVIIGLGAFTNHYR
jgi:hypothetical protein